MYIYYIRTYIIYIHILFTLAHDLILLTVHCIFMTCSATANSDPLESRFFIVLEILESTLEDRLPLWRKEINKTFSVWCGPCGYCCANKDVLQRTWIERLGIARCIASALKYLHSEEIIYRDLKPENIGFDPDGQVKLFDFGLSKRLLPDDKTSNGLYRLTGNTGSLRYMAPEVAMNECYNAMADSYSFAICFWQLCALTVPYAGYNVRMHADLVVGKGYRPPLHKSWPLSWGALMNTCWSTDIASRYDFDTILNILDDEYAVILSKHGGNTTDIRAKTKNEDGDNIAAALDNDTRIALYDVEEEDEYRMTSKQIEDVDIV